MKSSAVIGFLLWCLLLVPGFSATPAPAASADENDSFEILQENLHIVLIPEQNVFEQRRRYRYITNYLSKKMGIKVYSEILSNYGQICDSFINGEADAGFFGSFSLVLTNARTKIEPLARPVWPDGNSTYRSYLFVRRDSGITGIEDMRGKSLVLVDKATTAGYIFPLFYMTSYGISDLEGYFSRIYFAGSHDAAAWAVYMGEADVGACKNHIFNELAEVNPDFQDKMITLVESPEVPSNGLAVRQDLNPALKFRLKSLLLGMHETEEGREVLENFGARKFVETDTLDYRTLYKMVNELKIDLEKYPCNE